MAWGKTEHLPVPWGGRRSCAHRTEAADSLAETWDFFFSDVAAHLLQAVFYSGAGVSGPGPGGGRASTPPRGACAAHAAPCRDGRKAAPPQDPRKTWSNAQCPTQEGLCV